MGDAKALAKKAFGDRIKHTPHNATYYGHFQSADGDNANHIFFDSRGENYDPPDYDEPKWSGARDAITKVWQDREQKKQVEELNKTTRCYFKAFVEILKDRPSAKQAVINFGKDRVAQYVGKLKKL